MLISLKNILLFDMYIKKKWIQKMVGLYLEVEHMNRYTDRPQAKNPHEFFVSSFLIISSVHLCLLPFCDTLY